MLHVSTGKEDPSELYNKTGHEVWKSLLNDYPPSALDWIKHSEIIGPKKVPLNQIDWHNADSWVASKEPQKVALHAKLIEDGESKPVLLGKVPGHDKLIHLDGAHRMLASKHLGEPVMAYIAILTPENTEAAISMHSAQYKGKSRLDGT